MGLPQDVVPVLADDVEARDFGSYGVLASPVGGSFLHLESDEFAMLGLLDGSRSTEHLTAAHGENTPDLLDDLWDEGFLVGSPQTPTRRMAVTLHGIEVAGFDRVVRAIHRRTGTFLFSRGGVATIIVLSVAGLASLALQLHLGSGMTVSAASSASPLAAFVVLRLLGLGAVGLHESGHALVTVHYGRRVGRIGAGFYWGLLTFYVDASDAMFLPRRVRMLQAAAGVITDLTLAGTAMLVASASGNSLWALMLREFALLGYISVILDSVPLLELDGYWFLSDALDRPTLHRDARTALVDTVRRRGGNRRLAAYAVASFVFGIVSLAAGWVILWELFGGLFHDLWDGGLLYKALAISIVLPYLAMFAHVAAQPIRYLLKRRATGKPPKADSRSLPNSLDHA